MGSHDDDGLIRPVGDVVVELRDLDPFAGWRRGGGGGGVHKLDTIQFMYVSKF